MRALKFGLLSTVAGIACLGSGESADAQGVQGIYGGGSAFAAAVYRQLFDCYYLPIVPPVPPHCAGDVSGISAQILYASVGSTAGVNAFVNHNPALMPLPPPGSPPFTSSFFPAYPYPDIHFGASDVVLTPANVATYNANNGPAKWGMIFQIPAFATPLAIMFNGTDGNGNPLAILNPTPTGGSSGLNLPRQAVCGIFSGHITQWNDAILTAANGGLPLGVGRITVVHGSDATIATLLLSQALLAQCSGVIGPTSTGAATFSQYEFPWSDRLVSTTGCGGGSDAIPVEPTTAANWPDLGFDQCGAAIPNTGGGSFANASGSGGVTALVQSTNGAIGYVSPDFALPITGSLRAANLQSQYGINNNTGEWIPPTAAAAQIAMSSASADFSVSGLANPLTWSAQGVAPNPYLPGAYPISGFTWLNFYQCYAANTGVTSLIFNYLVWHYTNPTARAILGQSGFAPIPQSWLNAAAALVGPNLGTAGSGACAGVNPGA